MNRSFGPLALGVGSACLAGVGDGLPEGSLALPQAASANSAAPAVPNLRRDTSGDPGRR